MKSYPILYTTNTIKTLIVIRTKFKQVPEVSLWTIPQDIAKFLYFKLHVCVEPLTHPIKGWIETSDFSNELSPHSPVRSLKVVTLKTWHRFYFVKSFFII